MKAPGAALILLAALAGCGVGERDAPAPDNRIGPAATPTTVPAADRRAAAIAAAWPKGTAVPTESPQDSLVYDDHRLIDAPFGPVLVSHGHVPNGAHAAAGAIDIFYLEPAGAGFRVRRAFPKAVELGSSGDFSEWSITDRFTDLPVVYVEGGGMWQGYGCSYVRLLELRAGGPAQIVEHLQTARDNKGAKGASGETIEGKIADIRRGQSFTVRYEGTRTFAERYVRRGERFELEDGESQLTGC